MLNFHSILDPTFFLGQLFFLNLPFYFEIIVLCYISIYFIIARIQFLVKVVKAFPPTLDSGKLNGALRGGWRKNLHNLHNNKI